MMFASSSFDAAVRAPRRARAVATAVVVILDVAIAFVGIIARPRVAVAPRRAALGVTLGVAVVRVDSIARIARARSRVVVWRRRARAIVIHGVGPRSNPNPRFAFEPRARVDARSSIDARAGSPQTSARARAPRAMPRAGADVDVEALVRRAKTRLNALYGIQHVRANARASDGANGDDAWAIRDADAREVARGLFADDEDGDRTSLAMVKMAFCAVERKRRLERWEYGAEWLARAERDLTKARVECGEREIPAWFLKPDCDYAIEEEGDVWMTFERAGRAVARRAVRRMRDGYALVPKRELAETYAAAVAREIREDCDRVLRKMHAWLATGTAPRAFDPKCRWNALRIVRTYQPDASELPKISAPNGSNFAKARRERRRAQRVGGVAQHAIAVEADGEADAIETRPGAELRRARKALDSNVNRDVAARPFPPCMRNKMENLRRDAHLKYHDRFQLNLFFKGIGFTVNEALEFWRRGVFPKGRMKAYQGEHTYAIRHHYGLEGAMKDYTPHECDSLAEPTEGVRACPFVGSVEDLRQSSNSRDWYQALSFDGREAVELAVQAGDRRAACERVFADFHGGLSIGDEFRFPADYFDASMEIEDTYRDKRRRDAFSSKSVAAPPPDDGAPPAPHRSLLPERLQLDIEDSSSDEDPDPA